MDLPLFNDLSLMNPRVIVKDELIYVYGSYLSLFGTSDTNIHVIKLKVK